jgi:hypothetical protein
MRGQAQYPHGVTKGNCGHVMGACRCTPQRPGCKKVHYLAEECSACKKARALELEPLSPPRQRPPTWPTL